MNLRDKKVQIPLAVVLTLGLGYSAWDMTNKVRNKPWRQEKPAERKERLQNTLKNLRQEGQAPPEQLAAIQAALGEDRLDEAEEMFKKVSEPKEPAPVPVPTPVTTPAPPPVAQATPEVPTPPVGPPPVGVQAPVPPVKPWGRDPFSRPAVPTLHAAAPLPLPKGSTLVLSAVCSLGKKGKSYAIVNGVVVAEGEVLPGGEGWTLKTVLENGVLLLKDGMEYTLPIK